MASHAGRPETALVDLAELGFDAAIEPSPGRGWIPLDAYVHDPALLDAGLRLAGRRFARPEPSALSAAWFVADIAATLAWPAATVLLTCGTQLVSRPDPIHLPHPTANRRLTARFTQLPTSDRPASSEQFTAGLAASLQGIVEKTHRRTRRGRHALWGTVTDMVAAAFHRVGTHLAQPQQARDLADAVLATPSPLAGTANWHDIDWSGGTEHTRIRNICCLSDRAPGGKLCLTCPRNTDAQRRATLERRETR